MGRTTPRCVAAVALTAVLLLGACSDSDEPDSSATSTTAAQTTATTAPPSPAPYVDRGPYEVGATTVALADGRRVVIWYPAADAAADQPTETFDLASLLRPDLQAKVPADLRVQYPVDVHPGAPPATGKTFPVVLFSHGFAGYPEQSVTLTTHVASWGFIVVAPDHVERSLSGLLGTAAQGVAPQDDTQVLAETLDLVESESKRDGSPIEGITDLEHVAVTGHSAGAGAAYLFAATDDRIDSFIAYSVGEGDQDEGGTRQAPDKPGMVMLGTDDGIIPAAASKAVFAGMHTPKYLVEIDGAGHLVFSDICLIGADKGGVVAIAKQVGIPLGSLERLGSDGCKAPHPPVEDAFPAINDLSVDFLRTTLGVQDEPTGLDDPDIADAFDAKVQVTAEP